MKPTIGMIGLRVMGSNLARNIESRGNIVAVYNRNQDVLNSFVAEFKDQKFVASPTIEAFVASMECPRKIFLMIEAGKPVDAVLDQLMPHLEKGDIVLDGGNSYFEDTNRREAMCAAKGINFLGVGISGGEEGALKGPSIMPGGNKEAWQKISGLLDSIAAQAGGPCTTYIGPQGSGHFVKMVHNGIEYGDMQLIAEAYHLLKTGLGKTAGELAPIFEKWNEGPLSSFLIEITAKCLAKKDDESGKYLVDVIMDKAGQKGTGKWTAIEALKLGVSIPTLAAAVDARILSSMKSERVAASKEFASTNHVGKIPQDTFIAEVHGALYAAKILAYAQGMALLSSASKEFNWSLNLSKLAAIWKGGCIIRARFLDEIRKTFEEHPEIANLILAPAMKKEVEANIPLLRKTLAVATTLGIPAPAFSASLAYFDSYRSAQLPQNLTQAQRDFFGAHTYQRTDKDGTFHTHWE